MIDGHGAGPGPGNRQGKALGKNGEAKARTFLESQGLTVLDQNFRCPMGEIDLICQDRG